MHFEIINQHSVKFFQNLLLVLLTITLVPILTARTAGPADAVISLIAAPQPDYSTAARRDSLQGRGLFLIRFDSHSGRTSSVSVIHSTGHAILDEAAVKALRRWQIRPHTYDAINVPISLRSPFSR